MPTAEPTSGQPDKTGNMTFEDVQQAALAFRDARDWKQFHNPKDLAISISLEASELLETFQWSGTDTSAEGRKDKIAEELADVLMYCVYMADATDLDIPTIMKDKLARNEEHYPVEKARGTSAKYTELD